ncbi:MAG: serine hydrolase [Proteobacteria bacterium]|jgi:CubicO group peptidase (beta-lactamase class C family)|nr:serine hydrolase [Pseudomonadota bacterium]
MLEPVDPAVVGLSKERLTQITSWLEAQVADGKLAGASTLIARRGKVAYLQSAGFADKENGKVMDADTIVRIYSMSKSVTTVAAMMLYEQGCFQLDDPVAKYLPEFADTPVWDGGDAPITAVHDQQSPMQVKHLMNHTSGLTYGFMSTTPVDALYRDREIEFQSRSESLADIVTRLAKIPLLCQPGTQWNYSVATDVLGRLVEVWSGMSLAEFFQQRIFAPLGMTDTGFSVPEQGQDRFAALYAPAVGGDMSTVGTNSATVPQDQRGGLKLMEGSSQSVYFAEPSSHSGGGGLVGTIGDYARFCQMLINLGELDGERVLSPTTVRYMRTNQLPNNSDMAAMGQPVWSETSYDGIGFGLGFAVVLDPVKASIITSPGEHHWGGAASTFFWIDPAQDLFVVFFTQLMPSSTYPIRRELRTRVYQSIVD